VIIFVVRMRARHRVGGEGREVVPAVVTAMAVVWMDTRRAVVRMMWCQCTTFTLDLGGSCGEEVKVEVLSVVWASTGTPTTVWVETRGNNAGVRGI